jgi:hypothetical protein
MEGFMTKIEYDVTEYGAIPNDGKSDTSAIQPAIDACAASGGGLVRIPAGTFLSGALAIRDNVTVRIENSHVSFVGYTSMKAIYEHGVWGTREGVTKKLMRSDFPQRYGYTKDFYITLYVGYDPKVIE